MSRDKIFISYSHKDSELFEEFRTQLGDWGQLDIWTDKDLEASDHWRDEINKALERAAVAVFLVSPDFLDSKFIRNDEAPILLGAREDGILGLGVLFLRPSGVGRPDCVFQADLPSGGSRQVYLTDYQALNSPDKTIFELNENEKDRVYQQAVNEVIRLYDQYRQSGSELSKFRSRRLRLTVRLELGETYLSQRYLGPYSCFLEHRTRWSDLQQLLNGQARSDALFRVLFGLEDEDHSGVVLQQLLERRSSEPLPNPTLKAIRICIETNSHQIANLPWSQCSWQGQALVYLDWTFEFNRVSSANKQPIFSDVHVQTPCPVLAITPPLNGSYDGSIENHHHALQETLDNAWPVHKDRLLYATTWTDTKKKLHSRSPDIVYFCGRCQIEEQSLSLVFYSSQGDELVKLNKLAESWKHAPPKMLILSLLADNRPEVGIRVQTLLNKIPLVLLLCSPLADVQRARRSTLKWLNYMLKGSGHTDPVTALHLSASPFDSAWTTYEQWQVRTLRTSPQEQLARLLLDRRDQRTVVRGLVDEMRQQGQRRLTSFVAYGEHGNLVHQAAEQFMEYMRRHAREAIKIQLINLSLPEDLNEFDLHGLQQSIQRQIFSEDVHSEAEWLAGKRPKSKDSTSPFLFINFGCRGTKEDPGLTKTALEAWVAYCSTVLAPACPDDMGLLCCLALERPKDNYSKIEALLKTLMKNADYNNRLSRLTPLPPFGDIDETHLKDFLEGPNNSSCPDQIIGDMAEWITMAANGDYSKTVQWVEQAETAGWYTIYDQLIQTYGERKVLKTNEKPDDGELL